MLGGGIHALDLEASIKGRAYVGDFEREGAKASSELLAPLPNFRGQVFYDFGHNLGLAASTGWLSVSYDDSFVYVERLNTLAGDESSRSFLCSGYTA